MTPVKKTPITNILNDLYENLPIGVCVIAEKRFLMVNKQFESITGVTSKEMLSSSTIDHLLTCFKTTDRKKLLELISGSRSSQLESSIVNHIGALESIGVVALYILYTPESTTSACVGDI